MFVELIELLRCPREHEESPLVASSSLTENRHIVRGTLGCPVCGAEFPIENGEASFDANIPVPSNETPDPATAMRLAAFLELTDARGVALLSGRWGAHVDQVRRISETPILLINPPAGAVGDFVGVIRAANRLPFAAASARAAALDAGLSDSLAASLVRAVRSGGRIVGPAAQPLPAGVTELARDDQMWVAEKSSAPDAAPSLVPLRRA